jgi:hypothetical protein
VLTPQQQEQLRQFREQHGRQDGRRGHGRGERGGQPRTRSR